MEESAQWRSSKLRSHNPKYGCKIYVFNRSAYTVLNRYGYRGEETITSLKQAAKKGSVGVCDLAKEIARTRKTKERIYSSKAQLSSVSMQIQEQRVCVAPRRGSCLFISWKSDDESCWGTAKEHANYDDDEPACEDSRDFENDAGHESGNGQSMFFLLSFHYVCEQIVIFAVRSARLLLCLCCPFVIGVFLFVVRSCLCVCAFVLVFVNTPSSLSFSLSLSMCVFFYFCLFFCIFRRLV